MVCMCARVNIFRGMCMFIAELFLFCFLGGLGLFLIIIIIIFKIVLIII